MNSSKKDRKNVVSLQKLFAMARALWISAAFFLLTGSTTSSVLYLLCFAAWSLIFLYVPNEQSKPVRQISLILAAALSLFFVFGNTEFLEAEISVLSVLSDTIAYIIKVLTVGIGSFFVFSFVLEFLLASALNVRVGRERGKSACVHFAAVFFVCCVLIWTVYFLAFYPGVLSGDSLTQLRQVTGEISYSNHHPWVLTLLIKLLYSIGIRFWGNSVDAVGLCVYIQLLFMASALSFSAYMLCRSGAKKIYLVVYTIFFAVIPFNAWYSITLWKDISLSCVVLILTVCLWRLTNKEEIGVSLWIFVFFSGLCMCLFKTNAFYAFIACVPFIVLLLDGKRKKAISVVVCSLVILCAALIRGPVMTAYGVSQADTIESLSIPAQQIARVVAGEKELTEEEYDLLSKIIPVEKIPYIYKEYSWHADGIKDEIRAFGNQQYLSDNLGQYAKLWLSLGLRYPVTYINAFIDMTRGYWYPDIQYWVIWQWWTDELTIAPNTLGLETSPILPSAAGSLLSDITFSYRYLPFVGLLYSIGFYFWVFYFTAALYLIKKKNLLPFFPSFMIWGTLLVAAPVYAEFRYAYPLIICVPFLLGTALYEPARKSEAQCITPVANISADTHDARSLSNQ